MAKRIESPSSINTFRQCKRKYYYQYIVSLPTLPNIHQIRGNIAHSTLQNFYEIDVSEISPENYPLKFQQAVQKLFLHQWKKSLPDIKKLKLNEDQEIFYFEETMMMLLNWANQFIEDFGQLMKDKKIPPQEAFTLMTPIREQEYKSNNYSVHGFIDAIHRIEDEVHLIDYKTNSSFEVKDSIRLQLAIYSLLYHEKHGRAPSKVGIFFLRHKLKLMPVDNELLKFARKEIELVHNHTSKTNKIEDYPQTVSNLCRWNSGECDFCRVCKPELNGNGKK